MKRLIPAVLVMAALGGGCAVKTNVRKVVVEPPQTWSSETAEGVTTRTAELKTWWKEFHDAKLDALVDEAIAANFDVRIADARLREARAAAGVADAAKYPSVGTSGSVQRIRGGISRGGSGFSNIPGLTNEAGVFQAGFDASWELDLFGGVRATANAARADAVASEESRRDVLVTVLADVARNYVELRGTQRRIDVLTRNIATQCDTVELTRVRAKAGLATDLDVSRAAAQLEANEALLPQLEAAEAASIFRLGVLLGKQPGTLKAELETTSPIPAAPPEIPIGLPSELLKRRPDIRRAEVEIAAATARVGAAKAEYFPKFSLTGSVGRQANDVGGLTLGAGNFFAVGPSVRLPIFTAGRIRSQVQVRDAQAEQAVLRYEQSILRACGDVETSLTNYVRERECNRKLVAAVADSRRAVELADELYKRGLSDFLSVLDAQRAQLANEDQLAQSDERVTTSVIALYKALGGGW